MKDYRLYTLRLDHKMHDEVSDLAHFLRVNMSDVIREGINLKLKEVKKSVDSSL